MILFTVIEFKTAKIYDYEALNSSMSEDEFAVPLKERRGLNILDEEFKDTLSLPDKLHKEEDSDSDPEEKFRRRSFPLSPKAEKFMNDPLN